MTAALSAAEHGLKVDIYERYESVKTPIGGGFALNGALLCLTSLGYRDLYEKLMAPIENRVSVVNGKSQGSLIFLYFQKVKLFGLFRILRIVRHLNSPNISKELHSKDTLVSFDESTSWEHSSMLWRNTLM